jgi:hypothetical protein
MVAVTAVDYPAAMTQQPDHNFIRSLTEASCAPPAEAVSARVQELRADYGFPANQTRFIMLEAEAQLLALQRQNHCSIGLAIHG